MIRNLLYAASVFTLLAGPAASASDIRRVVTALDADNKAVVLFDSRIQLKGAAPRPPILNLWITDSSPPGFSFKDDAASKSVGLTPPDNGTIFRVVEFPPHDSAAEAKMDPNFLMKVIGDRAPTRGLPVKHPLMHRTRSVDYGVVLSGEIDMMLDDSVVHFKAGDVVVMQATNHAWINHGKEPCRMLFVLMDAKQP
jgi:mannose-6-phosphate isomerase-like protein (cupin superfamily)